MLRKMKANNDEGLKMVKASLLSTLPAQTEHIYIAPFRAELHNEDNVKWSLDRSLKNSIAKLPYVKVEYTERKFSFWDPFCSYVYNEYAVHNIAVNDYEKMMKE